MARGPRPRRWRTQRRRPDSRFPLLAVALLLTGCLIVSGTSAFPPVVTAKIGFGTSIPIAIAALAVFTVARRYRKLAFAATCGTVCTLATWTIIATAWTFSAATARWIAFGSGLGYMLAGVVMIFVHDMSPERVVHLLEVRRLPARS